MPTTATAPATTAVAETSAPSICDPSPLTAALGFGASLDPDPSDDFEVELAIYAVEEYTHDLLLASIRQGVLAVAVRHLLGDLDQLGTFWVQQIFADLAATVQYLARLETYETGFETIPKTIANAVDSGALDSRDMTEDVARLTNWVARLLWTGVRRTLILSDGLAPGIETRDVVLLFVTVLAALNELPDPEDALTRAQAAIDHFI